MLFDKKISLKGVSATTPPNRQLAVRPAAREGRAVEITMPNSIAAAPGRFTPSRHIDQATEARLPTVESSQGLDLLSISCDRTICFTRGELEAVRSRAGALPSEGALKDSATLSSTAATLSVHPSATGAKENFAGAVCLLSRSADVSPGVVGLEFTLQGVNGVEFTVTMSLNMRGESETLMLRFGQSVAGVLRWRLARTEGATSPTAIAVSATGPAGVELTVFGANEYAPMFESL